MRPAKLKWGGAVVELDIGLFTLGNGVILACFHIFGKSMILMKELMISVNGPAKDSLTGFRNLAGIRPGLVDVIEPK